MEQLYLCYLKGLIVLLPFHVKKYFTASHWHVWIAGIFLLCWGSLLSLIRFTWTGTQQCHDRCCGSQGGDWVTSGSWAYTACIRWAKADWCPVQVEAGLHEIALHSLRVMRDLELMNSLFMELSMKYFWNMVDVHSLNHAKWNHG